KLKRKSPYIAPGVGAAHFAGNRRKPCQHFGFCAGLEQCRLGVGRYVFGGFEYAEGTGSFGMRLTLGHFLPVEVRHLLKKMDIVQQDGTVGPDSQRIAVARGRRAPSGGGCGGCRFLELAHVKLLLEVAKVTTIMARVAVLGAKTTR